MISLAPMLDDLVAPARAGRGLAARRPVLLALSAPSRGALRALAAQWAARLVDTARLSLEDAASALHVGRVAHAHRFAVVAADADDAVAALHAYGECEVVRPGACAAVCHDGGEAARAAAAVHSPARSMGSDLQRLASAWVHGVPAQQRTV